jgi:hypothetical protein
VYGDPDALDVLAAALHVRAGEIREHADDHYRRALAARWTSTAAAAFREQVAADQSAAHRAASGIDHAADLLTAHAAQVRETVALIARFEREVTDWCERQARGAVHRAGDLARTFADALPGPGELRWVEVGRRWLTTGVS